MPVLCLFVWFVCVSVFQIVLHFYQCAKEFSFLSAEKDGKSTSNFLQCILVAFGNSKVSLTEINSSFCNLERYVGT